MITVKDLKITPTSMVSHDDRQHIVISCRVSRAAHLWLSVYREETVIAERIPVAFSCGEGVAAVLLPLQTEEFEARWLISDKEGNVLAQTVNVWKKPREWMLYVMLSSHTDLGLHDSQYIQRKACCDIIDAAVKQCDATEQDPQIDQYRYVMEGTWFWNNYALERGRDAAKRIVDEYIKPGKIGICSGMAGNHFQTFGLEEMCRSAYERRMLKDAWGVDSHTISMIDINGMPMSMIQPYVNAGYRNIIFAPNHWNPLPSTVWKNDRNVLGPDLNPEAGGGGSRVDVRYASEIPMVYNWENENGEYLTVWASTQYGYGGESFGIYPAPRYYPVDIHVTEDKMWKQLALLERKYPYDIWLFACYDDNMEPDRYVIDQIQQWNAKWKWPKLRTLGDPDEPFELLRRRFGEHIPVIRGDMAGGWYQHPLTVPELMAQKYEADRLLPVAEKWAAVACMTDKDYAYPATGFRRAWDHLLFNDEHSYGTSSYSGRKVYETWMQHRDWIEKAEETARVENQEALRTIAAHIPAKEASTVVFNPMAQEKLEYVENEDRTAYALVTLPPFGYRSVRDRDFQPSNRVKEKALTPPTVENRYYKIRFSENGSVSSIFDKALGRELVDTENAYRVNELVYTQDNHKSFITPQAAVFELERDSEHIRVIIRTRIEALSAEVTQTVTLPNYEKRIDIENELRHVRAMINDRRYYRYLYYAFPFRVENCRRLCHLNGAVAEYARDITGHGTDVYMDAQEWCCAENDGFGVALLMKEHQLTEFDHIHPDKTDFDNAGEGSQIFAYIANDWLQKQTPGGSHLDYRFRYCITSYTGGYRTASIARMAERFVTPTAALRIPAQRGDLPETFHSFLDIRTDSRFICLKRADDGRGVIARFYGEGAAADFAPCWKAEPITVDEQAAQAQSPSYSFVSYRLGKDTVCLKTREPVVPVCEPGVPAPIGAVYTGLITYPRAAAGEGYGKLYLLWGANIEEDLSHYKLFRSEEQGFIPSQETFAADVQPEDYVVGRYVDTELKDHTCYYYRVCAVNKQGVWGEFSKEFSAYTREAPFRHN